MGENSGELLLNILIVAIPVIIAITFHEAAHGFVAWAFGDPTAHSQGRVTFNPLKHVDIVGTIILPAALLLARAPFLFGWARPVPIDPSRLGNPRRDMILVAAAGPGINLALAFVSGVLLALAGPSGAQPDFLHRALSVSVYINAILAVFNMIPLPPLDGGRVAVGLLPGPLAYRLLKIEPFGLFIVIGVLILLPWISGELGHEINPFTAVIYPVILGVVDIVESVTGADVVQAWW
jgi:Zn-dependent protease